MDLELARRSHALLMQALERAGADRERFVDAACAGDPLLQTQAAALLAALDRSGPLLESPALHRPRGMNIRTALESPQIIHGYRIVRVIGVGGMATVYEAIQERPRRSVALKVLRHGLAQTSALQRFQFETEVLARLQHPGIAQIFEAGAFDDGQGLSIPFFAMEYIPDARPITVSASQRNLSLRARLDLFSAVCDAVQFGHQHGVIHRDLKPGNILVDPRGQPRVIDFGIARLSDPAAASITRAEGPGQLVGTLNYMSPEQCAGGAAIDIRTDVYSLGVILYELLCGRLPHDLSRVTLPEALRIVRETVAVRPAAIDPRLKGDIDAIVMTAMEKDPDRRYPTVAALAADIRRFLDDQPIQARPATLIYQIRRFARRHRALVTAALMVVAVLIAAGGWTTWAMLRWRAEAIRAQQAVDKGLVIKAFLEEIVASPDPATGQAEVRLVDVLRDASADVAERFANHPEVEADLRFVLARGFDNLALFPDALVHARRADELYRGLLPPDHPRALEAANSLAWLLYRARELDQATAIAQDVIARTAGKPALTSAHVTAQRAIASVLIFRDDYSAAEALLRAALETTHSTLGPSHGETLLAINDLAVLFQSRARRQLSPDPEKDLQDAVDLLSVALPAFVARFGEDGRHTLLVMLNLAANLLRQQRFAEAESYAARVLALTPRRYGRDHGFCIGALGLLGEIQFGQRKFAAAAQSAIQQVESLRRMTGGKQTAALLAAMSEALSILDAAGELETGAEYARTLHDAFSAMGSHAGTSTLEYAVYRARFLSRQGKREEADAIFVEVDGNDRDLPELLRWQIELSFGGHAAMSGRFEEAESRLFSVAASASGSWLILAQQELARLYEAFGNAEEADRWNALANTPSVAP